MALTSGTKLGPYEIQSPLGAGGMGEVYRATDPKLGRDVALKVLPAEMAYDPERLARFYEKVIKVKADVAAVLNYFFPSCIDLRWVTRGAVKGAAERGRSS